MTVPFDYDEQGQVIGAHELPKKKKGSYRIAGAADPDATYRVHGERIDFGYNISVAATDFITIPTITPNSGDVTHHPFKAEIAHFIQCLDENVKSHASIYDSYRSIDGRLASPSTNRRLWADNRWSSSISNGLMM